MRRGRHIAIDEFLSGIARNERDVMDHGLMTDSWIFIMMY